MSRLFEEVAFIAYHFHWSYDDIMSLEHRDRLRWIHEIGGINGALAEETSMEHARW